MKKAIALIILVIIFSACATKFDEHVRNIKKDAKDALEKNKIINPKESYSKVGVRMHNLTIIEVENNAIKYGLKPGDKIIACNGLHIKNKDEYDNTIRNMKIGDVVTLRVQRNYSELDRAVKTIDAKPTTDSYNKILGYTKGGDWRACINEANKLMNDIGAIYEIQTYKVDCMDCIKLSGGQVLVSEIAAEVYERDRLMINRASYIPGGVEKIRSAALYSVDWLLKMGFQAYAADIKKCLDDATEFSTKEPVSKDNVITNSTGTGFAISQDGLIVTAHHVVKDASSIKIHLNNGSIVKAKTYKSDPSNDIAILKIDVSTTNYLPIAPLRATKTGERVFTIGFPMSSVLGQEAKYTEGVISALSGIEGAASFLQITVPVQPGNSGGPLVNEDGYVVGIISSSAAILPFLANTGTIPQNINWAVKADYLRPLIDSPSEKFNKLNRDELIEKTKRSIVFIEATNQ